MKIVAMEDKDRNMCDWCTDVSISFKDGVDGLIPQVDPHECDIYAIICECPCNDEKTIGMEGMEQ